MEPKTYPTAAILLRFCASEQFPDAPSSYARYKRAAGISGESQLTEDEALKFVTAITYDISAPAHPSKKVSKEVAADTLARINSSQQLVRRLLAKNRDTIMARFGPILDQTEQLPEEDLSGEDLLNFLKKKGYRVSIKTLYRWGNALAKEFPQEDLKFSQKRQFKKEESQRYWDKAKEVLATRKANGRKVGNMHKNNRAKKS